MTYCVQLEVSQSVWLTFKPDYEFLYRFIFVSWCSGQILGETFLRRHFPVITEVTSFWACLEGSFNKYRILLHGFTLVDKFC
jgi:hypothetical protein